MLAFHVELDGEVGSIGDWANSAIDIEDSKLWHSDKPVSSNAFGVPLLAVN